ncbi:MAG: hypothetical protein CL927_08050 [Deltaproteobacteria bacterium]|nr:hypothetical protein [Deltaproteobacteria bacterium]
MFPASSPIASSETDGSPSGVVALRPALDRLVDDLDAHGVDSSRLRALRGELTILEEPPGFFARMQRTVASAVRQNWGHVLGELQETASLVSTLRKSLADGRATLTEAERADLRSQLADLLRMAPAAGVFLVLELFPIPGTGLLTPWLLLRMGLLPSRWREAHVVHALQKEAAALRTAHHDTEAAAVEKLVEAVEAGCRLREAAAHEATLLTHWDFNGDGEWNPNERAAYDAALEQVFQASQARAAERIWVLGHASYVFGPFRLSELLEFETDVDLLVCTGTGQPWVDLRHLMARIKESADREAPRALGPGDP